MDLDKLQIASVRLADTIFGFFMGNHPITTVDKARAVSEVITGLRNYLMDNGYIEYFPTSADKWIPVDPHDSEDAKYSNDRNHETFRMRSLSNFSKHADRDAHCKVAFDPEVYEDDMNSVFNAVLDYEHLIEQLQISKINFTDPRRHLQTEEFGTGTKTDILTRVFRRWLSGQSNHNKEPIRRQLYASLILNNIFWPADYDGGVELGEELGVHKIKTFERKLEQ